MLRGKKISILGDSISTYKGVSDNAAVNASLLCNPYFYHPPFPEEKLYWKRIIDTFGLELCVNNAWSGGNLSGKENPTSGVNRARMLARDDGTTPDIILVFMGINDFGRNVPISVFESDYVETLLTIKERYPHAKVCCVNLPDRDSSFKKEAELFNAVIDNAVRTAGNNFFVADLFNSDLNNDVYYMNTLDGLHPNGNGMRILAEVIEDAIRKNC